MVLGLLILAFAGPLVVGAIRAALSPATTQPAAIIDLATIARTLAIPAFIGVLATALAWPVAWCVRAEAGGRWQAMVMPLALCGLLLPNYLAYTGWSSVRSPGTWLGGVLERAGPATSIFAGQVIAVGALALWAWPMALLVLLPGVRRIEPATIDALRQVASPWRVHAQALAMTRGPVISAIALVTLIMLGSPVPMHLSQLETLGIKVMQSLAQAAGPGDAWRGSWPLILIAFFSAFVITSRMSNWLPGQAREQAWPRVSRTSIALALVVLALSVLIPMVLSASSLHSTRPIVVFWRDGWPTLTSSVGISVTTATVVGGLMALTWVALSLHVRPSAWSVGVVRVASVVTLVLALVPGVLVGSAIKAFANIPSLGGFSDWLVGSPVIVIWAHVARFGFLGVVGGWWLARLEPSALADARRLAGGETLAAWLKTVAPGGLAPAIGLALAGGALSLHEIEASIQVVPPASHPYLAQQLLDALHYLYLEQIAAANLSLGVISLGLAMMTGWLLWSREGHMNRSSPESQ